MNITIEADESNLSVIETEHRALILYGKIVGVFENGHPVLDCIGDKAIAIEGKGYLYTLRAVKELYDEWRNFIEGRRDTLPRYNRDTLDIACYVDEELPPASPMIASGVRSAMIYSELTLPAWIASVVGEETNQGKETSQ